MKTLFASVLLSLFAVGCATDPAVDQPAAEAQIHDAKCGCVLESVGHCGNYIEIDGEYVVLEYPELGTMEYCGAGEDGAKIKVTGEMKDGKFVATTYELVK